MIGRTLLHYTVGDKLGEGGMGVVYKATDTHLDRFVALKVLPPERVADQDRKRRFVQEAKAASALNHPNIVHVYDIATDQDTTFIAMEYVPGKTLGELIPRQGLPVGSVLKYAVQIADGLAEAHKAGIIHRDLKPGNVMVGDDGRVRILDFGLAKLAETAPGPEKGANAATLTASPALPKTDAGLVLGTVAYMSPEQAEGRPVDRRSDIFSFGVLLYEMVTGVKPFSGDTSLATLSAILRDTPVPVGERAAGVSPDLARVIDRCLRKDPARRWQHMEDVHVALLDLKEESDSGRLVVPVKTGAAAASRPPRLWAGVAALAVVVAGGVAWFATRPRATAPSSDTASLQAVPLTSYEGDERDPAFSPDGNQVAFSWGPEGGVTNMYVKLVGAGDPIRLTNSPYPERESQWSPDGPDGMLVGDGQPVAQSSRREYHAAISPDGSRIAFSSTRSGADEIWVSDRDGNNLVQLTSSANPGGNDWPAWSPDGTRIAYHSRPEGTNSADIFVIPAAGGAPLRLTDDPAIDARPNWSPDGQWIYFTSEREGGGGWKVPAAGGPATKVTDVQATVYRPSPDGKWLIAGTAQGPTRISLMDGQTRELVRDRIADAAMTSRGYYYLTPSADLKSSTLKLLPLDGGEPRTLGVIPHTTSGGLSVAPDFTSIIYSQCDQCAADLMLVEGFK